MLRRQLLLGLSGAALADRPFFHLHKSGSEWEVTNGSQTLKSLPLEGPIRVVPINLPAAYFDVFDRTQQAAIERVCTDAAARHSNDPSVVAYSFTRLPEWNNGWTQWYRQLPADAEGKERYVQFLKESYGYQIERLQQAYRIDVSSFTELLPLRWRNGVDSDDNAFLGWIAEAVFEATVRAIRSRDKSHLILSPRMDRATPRSVIAACAKLYDALWAAPGVEAPFGRPVLY